MHRNVHRINAVALVLVLCFLVLISAIVLAFLSSVTTERSSSDNGANATRTNQLADSAMNIVMAQIVAATSGSASGSTLAWTSQPGMIRTFDATGTGTDYKLYSSDQMTVASQNVVSGSTGASVSGSAEVPVTWNSGANVDIYTDLNAPGVDAEGNLVFPIVDPIADGISSVNRAADNFKVDGFSVNSPASWNGTQPESPSNNRAPMPVKWLYVLKNGMMQAATANGTGPVTIPSASSTNPIVGRIAFWTDDETSKININTASEGTFWDMPREYSLEDCGQYVAGAASNPSGNIATTGLAICQPAQHEFQRYPGHPATTCLSPVFGGLLPVPFPYPDAPTSGTALDPYYNIAPRVGLAAQGGGGGSKGGTVQVIPTASTMTVDSDRLYASVDEVMFTPALSGTSGRIPNTSVTTATNSITKGALEKARFFITANSTAPETTLYNTPRVAIWPVWDSGPIMSSGTSGPISIASGSTVRTTFDNVMAFCSTIGTGTNSYYFTRANARSNSVDYAIPRNALLYQYLQALTGSSEPGFGGNFLAKYGAGTSGITDRDQILTSIYDYIRCTSLQDRTAGPGVTMSGTVAMPYTPLFVNPPAANGSTAGAGEVVPIQIPVASGTTMGFGRYNSISSANLLFYGTLQVQNVAITQPNGHHTTQTQTSNIRAILLFQFADAGQGLGCIFPNMKYTVTSGLDGMQVADWGQTDWQSLNFQTGSDGTFGTDYIDAEDIDWWGGRSAGGTESAVQSLLLGTGAMKPLLNPGGNTPSDYPFFSGSSAILQTGQVQENGTNTFLFKSTKPIVVQIRTADTNQLVQTLNFAFPSATGTFTIPPEGGFSSGTNETSYASRVMGTTPQIDLVGSKDTVVSMEVGGYSATQNGISASGTDPTAGDTRMVECLPVVPATRFRADNNYMRAGVRYADDILLSGGWTDFGEVLPLTALASGTGPFTSGTFTGTWGKLVPVPNYFQSLGNPEQEAKQPDVPSRVGNQVEYVNPTTNLPGGPGDWDAGFGDQKDGAYINKPDEGDSDFTDTDSDQGGTGVLRIPYLIRHTYGFAAATNTYFSPNREVPSPMMFGSIPTGVQRQLPWQTLLFNPHPEDTNHPGFGTPVAPAPGTPYTLPPDHVIADLFWMPVIEPYAISQPFATDGKINMNYEIMPFTYIKRQTGMYGVMKSTKFMALPLTDGTCYKYDSRYNPPGVTGLRRHSIDIQATLSTFDSKFQNNDVFRSASQICEINLIASDLNLSGTIPSGQTPASIMASFWANNKLTGTNLRDKPYVDLYPRLTTKSNTYTVHVRVQTLQKSSGTPANQWVDGQDQVVGEYRGSSILERYIDVNDPTLPDFAGAIAQNPNGPWPNIDQYYKMRVISTKRFAP